MKYTMLQNLGFTQNESKVYLALLELGSCRVGDIMKKCQIHRPNVYDALNKLIAQKLVGHVTYAKSKYFHVTDPDNLNSIIIKKQDQLKSMMPELKLTFNMSKKAYETQDSRSRVTIRYGDRTFARTLYGLLLHEDDILVYGIPSEAPKRLGFFINDFQAERVAKRIKMKHIYNYNVGDRIEYLNGLSHTEAKYLPEEFDSNVTTLVCKDEVHLIFWKEDIKDICIVDKEIASTYRRYFYLLYQLAR